jgi:hypothetical protein
MHVEQRIADLGYELPPAPAIPANVAIPFLWVRVLGQRALVSGHGAIDSLGVPEGPFGKVPTDIPLEQAQISARTATLSMLSSLKRALGDLDRIAGWGVVNGFVNAEPSYAQTTLVINPCSDLLLELFGVDVGGHARTAIGVAALPFNLPVVLSAELMIAG